MIALWLFYELYVLYAATIVTRHNGCYKYCDPEQQKESDQTSRQAEHHTLSNQRMTKHEHSKHTRIMKVQLLIKHHTSLSINLCASLGSYPQNPVLTADLPRRSRTLFQGSSARTCTYGPSDEHTSRQRRAASLIRPAPLCTKHDRSHKWLAKDNESAFDKYVGRSINYERRERINRPDA